MSERLIGEGGGAMTALTFGLAITNYQYIMNVFKKESKVKIDKQKLREFHDEITFFIKSFFFVYIGVVTSLSLRFMFFGLIIVIVQMVMRYVLVELLNKPLMLTKTEKVFSQGVYASGLPAFVMSQLPLIFDPDKLHFINPGIYPDIAMPIVLGTILYSSFIGPMIVKRGLSSSQEKPERILNDKERYSMLWNDENLRKIQDIG
jgi:cell volume regulation protein A